jgi:hypothetical protein
MAEKLEISGTDTVDYAANVVGKIAAYNQSVMTDVERFTIVGILLNANIQDKKARKDHVKETRALRMKRSPRLSRGRRRNEPRPQSLARSSPSAPDIRPFG